MPIYITGTEAHADLHYIDWPPMPTLLSLVCRSDMATCQPRGEPYSAAEHRKADQQQCSTLAQLSSLEAVCAFHLTSTSLHKQGTASITPGDVHLNVHLSMAVSILTCFRQQSLQGTPSADKVVAPCHTFTLSIMYYQPQCDAWDKHSSYER